MMIEMHVRKKRQGTNKKSKVGKIRYTTRLYEKKNAKRDIIRFS